MSYKSVPQEFPTSDPQECATRVSRKSVLQECPLDILVFRSCLHSGLWVPSCLLTLQDAFNTVPAVKLILWGSEHQLVSLLTARRKRWNVRRESTPNMRILQLGHANPSIAACSSKPVLCFDICLCKEIYGSQPGHLPKNTLVHFTGMCLVCLPPSSAQNILLMLLLEFSNPEARGRKLVGTANPNPGSILALPSKSSAAALDLDIVHRACLPRGPVEQHQRPTIEHALGRPWNLDKHVLISSHNVFLASSLRASPVYFHSLSACKECSNLHQLHTCTGRNCTAFHFCLIGEVLELRPMAKLASTSRPAAFQTFALQTFARLSPDFEESHGTTLCKTCCSFRVQ